MPVTLELKGLRQENCHEFMTILGYTAFQASNGYIARPCHEQTNSPKKKTKDKRSVREGSGPSLGLAVQPRLIQNF